MTGDEFAHVKSGNPIERIETKSAFFNLTFSDTNLEVVEVEIKRGKWLAIIPFEDLDNDAVEIWYVVKGSMISTTGLDDETTLEPGDAFSVRKISESVIFTAQSDTRLLYITNKPSFHEMSIELQQLMNLAIEVEVKDGYTADHCLRIQELSFRTGKALGFDSGRLLNLSYGAYLHDLGKVKIPEEILNKKGPLTDDEWAVMKRHPGLGEEMMKNTVLERAGKIVAQHHERVDGSGYPLGLKGDEVLTEASIVAVVDTYDAMTTNRPYRKALPEEVAYEEIKKFAGTLYPQRVVDAFIKANKYEENGAAD